MGRAVARCGARPDGGDRWFEVLRNLFDRSSDPWWDDVRTTGVKETRDDVLRAAMKDTGAELAGASAATRGSGSGASCTAWS